MTIDTKRLATDAAYWDSVAPEGATHYDKESELFVSDKYIFVRGDAHKRDRIFKMFSGLRYILRPTKPAAPEWDGEGLPPVGSTQRDCELVRVHADVKQFEIVAHRNGAAIVYVPLGDNDSDAFPALPCHFRPIRTKEQRQRERLQKIIFDAYESGVAVIAEDILSRYNLEPKP